MNSLIFFCYWHLRERTQAFLSDNHAKNDSLNFPAQLDVMFFLLFLKFFIKVLAGPEWLSTETVALSELSRKVFDITAKFCCKKSKLLNSICGNKIVVANQSKIDNISAIVLSVKSGPKRGLVRPVDVLYFLMLRFGTKDESYETWTKKHLSSTSLRAIVS